jgi:hypothetical protein
MQDTHRDAIFGRANGRVLLQPGVVEAAVSRCGQQRVRHAGVVLRTKPRRQEHLSNQLGLRSGRLRISLAGVDQEWRMPTLWIFSQR